MSATKPTRAVASPDARQRERGGARSRRHAPALGSPPHETLDSQRTAGLRAAPRPEPDERTRPETWWEWFQQRERARAERLRPLWELTPPERVAAMRRGELTYEQLDAWGARHPEQVPTVDGEFEWIVARFPEACE